jgi:hypothetical protein
MLPVDEVLRFSVEYINQKKERTSHRKVKIRSVYRELFGRDMPGSCSTCYIEALLEIVKSFKKIEMATPNYELKRGVLLESFGHPEKTCTNTTLTDELAEWHLREHPEKAVYFARMPAKLLTPVPPPVQQNEAAPEVIIYPSSKEDPARKKLLVDKALELGFVSSPESPIDLIKIEELEVIITNLEKAKVPEKPIKKPSAKKPKTKK